MTSEPKAVSAENARKPAGRNLPFVLLLLGAAAGAVTVFGFVRDPARAYHAYLAAYALGLSFALGSLAFVMIAHAANTTWPVAVRRIAETVSATLPLFALLFIPILFGLRSLYPWARAEEYSGELREILEHRRPFMNPTFFAVRAFAYLAFWSVLAWLLRHYSIAMERGADPQRCGRVLRRLSYAGLPLASITAGISAYGWLMSLSAEFASTMFSALWIALCLLAGVACTIIAVDLAQRGDRVPLAGPSHAYALGRLLFAFLIFFGYTAFFQYLLVWMANRPSEAAWYVERSRAPYGAIAWFLIGGEFLLPFLALLSYRLKRSFRALVPVALWCSAALYMHLNWIVTPSSTQPGPSWLDPVALIAVLSLAAGFAGLVQRGVELAPISDPRYPAALRYESH